MKKNSSKTRYQSISNLKEIQYEKQLLYYKIKRKENMIKNDWTEISESWVVLSFIGKSIHKVVEYIPVGLSYISRLSNLLRKRR